jgi:hypothetical protein
MLARCAMALVALLLSTVLIVTSSAPTQALGSDGSVTGRVVDAEGQPVQAVQVNWVSTAGWRSAAMDGPLTDVDGRFVLELNSSAVVTGSLQFSSPSHRYATEFLGNTALINEAEVFDVGGGVHTTLPDFVLSPYGSISGTVSVPSGEAPESLGASAWGWNDREARWEVVAQHSVQNGRSSQYSYDEYFGATYEIRGLPPGSYRVCAGVFTSPDSAQQCFGDTPSPGTSPAIHVDGTTVRNVDFAMYYGGQVEALVTAVGGGVLTWSTLELYSRHADTGEWRLESGSTHRMSDGAIRHEGLRTGTYRAVISAYDYGREYYPNAATVDQALDFEVVAGGPVVRIEARLAHKNWSRSTSTELTLSTGTHRPGISPMTTATASVTGSGVGSGPEGTLDLLLDGMVFGTTTIPNIGNTLTAALPTGAAVGDHQVVARFTPEASENFFYSSASGPTRFTVLPPLDFLTVPKPIISGTGKAGSTLTATAGTWNPAPATLAYQWFRSGAAIPGATARTYTLTHADTGSAVAVRVAAARNGYTTRSVTSAPTLLITGKSLAAGTPAITGSAHVGKTLTASTGSWKPAPVTFAYSWRRNGVSIPGAAGRSYTLTKADAGAAISVSVTATKFGYTTVRKSSPPMRVARLLTLTPAPVLRGHTLPGSRLSASVGTWGPGTIALTYSWKRNGVAIPGATSRTYVLTRADADRSISVTVTGRRSGYTTVSKTSAAKTIAPDNPGNVRNCSDFATPAAAQSWFDRYYPAYGDVAFLDGDGDRIACELQ